MSCGIREEEKNLGREDPAIFLYPGREDPAIFLYPIRVENILQTTEDQLIDETSKSYQNKDRVPL